MSGLETRHRKPGAAQMLILLGSLVVVIAGLKAAQGFFVPMLLAFFLATVSFPITNWLRNHKVPRAVAVLLTVLVDFAFLAGLVLLAISIIGDLQEKWNSEYSALTITRLEQAVDGVAAMGDKVNSFWSEGQNSQDADSGIPEIDAPKAIPVPEGERIELERLEKESRLTQAAGVVLAQLRELKFAQVWNVGTDVVARVVSFFGTSLVILILTVFMLTEARMFGRRFDAICEARGPNIQRLLSALKDTQRYLGIKTAISLATGVLAGTLCWAAGLDFYVLWAILAFALNYIPVVGSVIAGLPPTILALLVNGPPEALAIMGGYVLINTFLGNFIEPMLMGRRFGLSTLIVLLSVLFWGWLWGPIGMLLAVPLTMMVKVVLDNSNEFRWIAVAIGKETHGLHEEKRILKEGAAEKRDGEAIPAETAEATGQP
ncbi:AI-2E family transporter [Haloferula chungangensis]|uniref:AI-2E family transporter n=1 Tax=Haloferula chungangensis TaxID=1048331 RepID=A0ABW2L2J4_9BACT